MIEQNNKRAKCCLDEQKIMITKKHIVIISFFMVSFFFVFNYSDNICGYVSNMYYDKHQEDDLDNANLTRIEHDDVVAVFETENTPLPRENKYGNVDEIVARGEVVVCAKKDDNNALFQVKTEDGRYVGKDVELF